MNATLASLSNTLLWPWRKLNAVSNVPTWLLFLLSIPVGFAGLLYAYQNSLIYPANFPPGSREHVDTPDELGLPYEDVTLTTPDGLNLKAYFIRPKIMDMSGASRPTILYLHANAGNLGHRIPIAFHLFHRLDANVFMLSYRGYGKSDGKPSEKGLKIDAQTALDYLLSHPTSKNSKIIVFGQSIGGAVTIDLVARNENKVAAMMIENTFLSIPDLIPSVLPQLRYLTFLCHQIWPSKHSIAIIRPSLPILFLSSGKDEMIPQAHMKQLRKLASSKHGVSDDLKHRVWVEFPSGTHNDAPMQNGYFEAIVRFVEKHV
ncbi:Alpha/Beta hydrolase protein [Catenaria anguillulae PL171]|uniref:Alpha/Beta hydrolase protein n=1 Tax=Catenaria anguillulae PL171 TaxID=765915 RepID=A0A1Y2HY07_9FUNG|nr:Alpha/Beta hydrolase protein [Catenaria anguillulae PL171]